MIIDASSDDNKIIFVCADIGDRRFMEMGEVLGYEFVEDEELFGDGVFISTRGSLSRRVVPCGCAFSPRWAEEQMKIRVQRVCEERGYKFLGWSGDYSGHTTKILLESQYGVSSSVIVNSLLKGHGCPKEAAYKTGQRNLIPDQQHIEEFLETGQFDIGTKFERNIIRKNSEGRRKYWDVTCPVCMVTYTSYTGSLKLGHVGCDCGTSRQKECYINFINDGDTFYLKFGIANSSKQRLKAQNYNNTLQMEQHAIYEFPTKEQCLAAERECLNTLIVGVVDKQLMPDGWTETTYISNLEAIIKIYEMNGGVRVETNKHHQTIP